MVEEKISQEFRLKIQMKQEIILLKKWIKMNRWVKSTKMFVLM